MGELDMPCTCTYVCVCPTILLITFHDAPATTIITHFDANIWKISAQTYKGTALILVSCYVICLIYRLPVEWDAVWFYYKRRLCHSYRQEAALQISWHLSSVY